MRLVFRGLPDGDLLRHFGSMAISIILKCISNMSAYSLMTKTASKMGATALAAHQVTLQVWWLLSYIPEPASTAAQTLVARDLSERPGRVPKLTKILVAMSGLAGVVVALATGAILSLPNFSRLLIADVQVQGMLQSIALPAMLAQIVCSVGSLMDGLAVGCGYYKYLPVNATIGLINLAMSIRFRATNVARIWFSSLVFFASRILGHLVFNQRIRRYLFSGWGGIDEMETAGSR